jgi:hypothetical protein
MRLIDVFNTLCINVLKTSISRTKDGKKSESESDIHPILYISYLEEIAAAPV